MVHDAPSHFVSIRANIQEPKVCLNRYSINMGRLYAGIQEIIWPEDEWGIVLKNYGNIPVQFQWDEKMIPDRVYAQFEPARGVIPPHSEQEIRFDFTLYVGGAYEEIFTCHIMDQEYPLAFMMTADVFGLQVSHEMP